MLSLKTHNVLDYVVGATLVACPYIFGFSDVDIARNVFLTLGLGLIGYSMITKYYYSVLKIIPVGLHMGLDVVSGAALILAPFVLGYNDVLSGGQLLVHFAMGAGAFLLVGLTRNRSTPIDMREPVKATPLRRAG